MKFLLVRFTHGSGGKFLSSVLQTSSVVDHWSTTLQANKQQPYWSTLVDQYTRRSFPANHIMALRSEPHVPYNCDLYSHSRDRGYNVDIEQYLTNARHCQDYRLLACLEAQTYCNLVFNRPRMPKFCDNMPAVTIVVSTPRERDWLDRTVWSKHFVVTENEIIYAPDDPDYCHITRLPDVIKYANQSRWPKSETERLYHDMVCNNYTRDWYFNPEKFEELDREHGNESYFLPLWSFFDGTMFQHSIKQIFEKFSLGDPDIDLIEKIRHLWIERQHTF